METNSCTTEYLIAVVEILLKNAPDVMDNNFMDTANIILTKQVAKNKMSELDKRSAIKLIQLISKTYDPSKDPSRLTDFEEVINK